MSSEEFEIIDAHVHLHRNVTQEKQSFFIPGRRDRDRWGNAESIIAYMDREGISKTVCLNLFPTEPMRDFLMSKIPAEDQEKSSESVKAQVEKELASRLRRHNEWLCAVSMENPRIVAGIGIQKLLTPEEMVEEVEARAAQGAKTVKLLPGMFRHFPNDRAFWPLYEKCQEIGMPVTLDSGTLGELSPEGVYYGEPANFVEVLESFPKLTVVMCHLASAFWDQRVEMAQRFSNLFFDMSGSFNRPPNGEWMLEPIIARDAHRACAEEDAVRIIRKVGVARIMWGTDGPAVMARSGIEQVLRLDLTDEEKRKILAQNAKRIYEI
jgi:predicted TIM-barrel fold metal-dependent hydrolase